jgi:hypothetical protein
MLEDKVIRADDFTVFCRSLLAQESGYLSVAPRFVTDVDGKIYSPASRLSGPQGPIVEDALRWIPTEDFLRTFDTINLLQRHVRIRDKGFFAVLKGFIKPRTGKAEPRQTFAKII